MRSGALGAAATALAARGLGTQDAVAQTSESGVTTAARRRPNPIAVSSYSFWRYNDATKLPIEKCIDLASDMGFDGFEVLHVQMNDESNSYLQMLKRRAFKRGLALCGFSTHQGFVYPEAARRKKYIDHTIHCMQLAHEMGIPTMRVNTGRWGTTKSFDDLMANKGIEPRLEGYTDEDGFGWVIDSFEQLIPHAEKIRRLNGTRKSLGARSDRRRCAANR